MLGGAAGNVIDDHRQLGGCCGGLEVLIEALRRRLVVIRPDKHYSINGQGRRLPGKLDGGGGVGGSAHEG